MKILFLTNHLQATDGWSRYSLDFIKEIQNSGHQVLVLTSQNSSQMEIKELPILEKPLKYLVNPLRIFLISIKIKRTIKEFSPEVIHFMAEPYANILPFLGDIKAKTYITCQGTYSVIPNLLDNFFGKKLSQFLSKKYFQKLTGIIAASNYTKNYLLKYYPGISSKIKVVANGIDLDENQLIDLDKKPKNEIKKMLFVGAVKKRKGVLEAIEACKYYRDTFSSNFIYNLIGDYDKSSNYYQQVVNKIKEYHLEDKILFQGKITNEELEEYYFNADLFLMPSININHNFEGFGLVFLEANAKGVPCIGPKNSGCQEAILEGRTGYLITPFDFKGIVQKMNLILKQDSVDKRNCLNWAKQNDIKLKVKEIIKFYNK